jgi:hypothetical protein
LAGEASFGNIGVGAKPGRHSNLYSGAGGWDVFAAPRSVRATSQRNDVPEIEITLGGACVRVRGAVDARTLAAVLKVLRVLA